MNRFINYISSVNSIIMIALLIVINNINKDNYFNGISIIIIMSMLMINPICNMYRNNKKQINNLFYHLILNISLIYNIYLYNNYI